MGGTEGLIFFAPDFLQIAASGNPRGQKRGLGGSLPIIRRKRAGRQTDFIVLCTECKKGAGIVKSKILDICETLLIFLAIISALILCAKIVKEKANNNAAQKYNGGICAKCGAEYQFDGTSGAVFTLYNYHCPSCGETINAYAPMIKTDGGTK